MAEPSPALVARNRHLCRNFLSAPPGEIRPAPRTDLPDRRNVPGRARTSGRGDMAPVRRRRPFPSSPVRCLREPPPPPRGGSTPGRSRSRSTPTSESSLPCASSACRTPRCAKPRAGPPRDPQLRLPPRAAGRARQPGARGSAQGGEPTRPGDRPRSARRLRRAPPGGAHRAPDLRRARPRRGDPSDPRRPGDRGAGACDSAAARSSSPRRAPPRPRRWAPCP